MSSIPMGELSTHYTYIGEAMSFGVRKIIDDDYVIENKIPINVLRSAKELFEATIKVIDEIPPSTKEATACLMVLDHLREANPNKYPNEINPDNIGCSHKLIYQDVRNLASLVDNLGKLKRIPTDQREDCKTLQKLFILIAETGEREACEKQTSGNYTGRYDYIIGDVLGAQ